MEPEASFPTAPSLRSKGWRLSLFTLLYLYQGLIAGFALTALANHFAAMGASTENVGRHLAVVGLPWVLQPLLWGPLIDRAVPYRMGPRRFWLVIALVCAQACLCGLFWLGATPGLTAVSAVLGLHSLSASLADTATDRMIAGNVPTDELGRTSAGTRAGFVIGNAIGAALFAWVLARQGFPAAVAGLLVLTTPIALVSVLVREAPDNALLSMQRLPSHTLQQRLVSDMLAVVGRLFISFRNREAATLLAVCFSIDLALALFQIPFAVSMVRTHGWDASALSRLQALLALLGGTLGAAGIGAYVDRTGPARALGVFLAICAAAFGVATALIAAGLEGKAGPIILGLASVVPALVYVALLPTVLLASREGRASATQFQIFMAAMNFGDVAGASLAGALETVVRPAFVALSVAGVFLFCAWVTRRPAAGEGRTRGDSKIQDV